jgi:molybdenum cofactor synthesis domain-containing protein
MERKEFRDLAPPARAHEVIAGLDLSPGTERVPTADARGRVLAERVDADVDVPGFDRASLDGYAVRARDTFPADEASPVVLERLGTVHAGEAPDETVEPGGCVEVSTGAVLPPGADAVVMVEETAAVESGVEVRTRVAPGEAVMFAGADVAAGDRALGPGTRLTSREIGLLSALGLDEVAVRARPVVGIVSTGDELVRPGEPLDHSRGEIYDVNSYSVAAGVEEAGGRARLYPHAGDDYDEMERLLHEAADECDLVLSSGSTSASAVDVIYRVIEERGALLLHGVAVKPGKPMLVGRLGGSAYVGLPGYPVSALTIFRTFVAPAIRESAGLPEPRTATVEGRMAIRERYAEGRLRLVPVGLVEPGPDEREGPDDLLVYPVDKGSGATTSLVEADGIVEMPADTEYLDRGEHVEVSLFSPDVRPPTLLLSGEDDPALSRLLDRVDRPRHLPVGSREGLRRLREGALDAAVVAGPTDRTVESREVAAWTREWGLAVAEGSGVDSLADLVDRDVRFVNRTTASGLRTSLDDALGELAVDRGVDRRELSEEVAGYGAGVRAHESPVRAVARGDADAGLGLRATADRLGLPFRPLGEQTVRVLAAPARVEKPGLCALVDAVAEGSAFVDLAGYAEADASSTNDETR